MECLLKKQKVLKRKKKVYEIIKINANTRGTAQRTQNTFRGQ